MPWAGNDREMLTTVGGPKGNSEFCFPQNLNVSRDTVERNIEILGKQNSLLSSGPVIKQVKPWIQLAHSCRSLPRFP